MDYFTEPEIQSSRQQILAIAVSAFAHVLLMILILSLPFFITRSQTPMQFVDVTLLDAIFPGDSGDIAPPHRDTPPDIKPIEKPEIKPARELTDPSDAELDRMKKRTEQPTPSSKKDPAEEFPITNRFLPDRGGQASGSMQVDAKDFPFFYYLSMLRNRVSENWIPPYGAFESESKRVVIAFRIDRQGSQYSARVEESSGDVLLDQSALRAVIVSSPFPPLPEGFTGASLGVYFGFSVQL
jgi:TonB family protein